MKLESSALWGKQASQIRKFLLQDGRICEAVAWEVGPSERHTIPDLIVRCILERQRPGAVVQGFAGLLDWTLQHRGPTLDEQIHARR